MKIKSCSAKKSTKKDSPPLSFEGMKDSEGIYSSPGYETKFVVLKSNGGNSVVICLYNNELKPASSCWRGESFIRCWDEEVCFEIRKKGA